MAPAAPNHARPSLTQGTSYDDMKAGKPPIKIQIAPKPSQARLALHPMHRAASASSPELDQPLNPLHSRLQEQEARRDSGLGTAASKRDSRATTVGTDKTDAVSIASSKNRSVKRIPSLPRIDRTPESPSASRSAVGIRVVNDSGHSLKGASSLERLPTLPDSSTSPLSDLPSFSLEDLTQPNAVQFSKRGSLLIKGRRPSSSPSTTPRMMSPVPTVEELVDSSPAMPSPLSQSRLEVPQASSRPPRDSTPNSVSRTSLLPNRALTPDEETLSRRILSMYETGEMEGETTSFVLTSGESLAVPDAAIAEEDENRLAPNSPAQVKPRPRSPTSQRRSSTIVRENLELAGGLEDWNDVQNDEVDRYGFITKKPPPALSAASPGASYVSLNSTMTAPEGMGISRMATQLRIAAETPRRSRSMRQRLGRSSSNAGSAKSAPQNASDGRQSVASNRTSRFLRPTSSQASHQTATTVSSSRIRRAGNHLPHNKDRKVRDEAGDMLTLPPGLADVAEKEALSGKGGTKAALAARAKEQDREEKWRKMAKVVKSASKSPNVGGGGMQFTFDTSSPKVISRTWKGIPDRWRASAWWSFLETSAKKRNGCMSSDELIAIFYDLVEQSCADDVQIDLDVPRTIGGHIMFRRRYRGGQRLLFRVLHAMSLYFPDPGYVQGMACLAATFLCYFEEERAFVMLVRMWELRGLAKLYRAGFEGLMTALDEFKEHWLAGGVVGEKLDELNIPPTSYGTRWYLTVFNYSIPFSAQLRVWDVFLLLGDPLSIRNGSATYLARSASAQPSTNATEKAKAKANAEEKGFDGCLNVLHAVSAALIDGTRDILLDSDFDNAMKTLTSWIPIRDDELLMRVAKVEYKYHKARR